MEKGNNLTKKYLDGDTSLEQEEVLFRKSNNSDPGLASWSKYVNIRKKAIPKNLNNFLWDPKMFDTKKTTNRYIYVVAIMITISVLGILYTYLSKPKTLDYATKKMLLDQAIAMTAPVVPFPETKQIIYEDEMIIIYTSK